MMVWLVIREAARQVWSLPPIVRVPALVLPVAGTCSYLYYGPNALTAVLVGAWLVIGLEVVKLINPVPTPKDEQ